MSEAICLNMGMSAETTHIGEVVDNPDATYRGDIYGLGWGSLPDAGTAGPGLRRLERAMRVVVRQLPSTMVFGSMQARRAASRAAFVTDDDYEFKFSRRFERNPITATHKLLWDVMSDRLSKPRAIKVLFNSYLDCPMEWQSLISNKLSLIAEPKAVLHVALQAYNDLGFEGHLSAAATLLEKFGIRAWSTIKELVESRSEASEFFVQTIAFMPGVEDDERKSVFYALADSPHVGVRKALLEALEYLPASNTREIFEVLARDPDEVIRETAMGHFDD